MTTEFQPAERRLRPRLRSMAFPSMLFLSTALLLFAATPLLAQLDVRPRINNFDTTLCGSRKCHPMVFKNSTATSITINSVDAFFTPFALDPSTPFNFPKTIAPGDSLLFSVCYSPTTTGVPDSFKGYVRYDAAGLDSFLLVGRPTGGALSLTTVSTNFGTVQVFNTGCLTVRLTNTGDGTLVLGPVTGVPSPFTVQTPPPASLTPGSSVDVTICFTPVAAGPASVTPIFWDTACSVAGSKQVTLQGTGVLPPRVTLGPVLEISPNPLDFDTTLCGTTKCQTLTLRNIGSAQLSVTKSDLPAPPFSLNASTPLTLPITLQPNESRSLQFCYSPATAPAIDSLRLALVADNRVSLSIAMVFDTSGSMTTQTGAGATRIGAANTGGKVFLDNLVNDPGRGIVDTAAVIRFSSGVVIAQDFTTNAAALSNAVPASASGSTRIYDALNAAIDLLNLHNQAGRRVIVLLTDGDDDLDFSNPAGRQTRIDAMVARAQNNVRIFTIGLGNGLSANGIDVLQQLATRTNGSAYFTSNPDTLVRIYQTIAQELSRNIPGSFLLRGRAVAPRLVISPTLAEFDSVRVRNTSCRQVTFTNTGDAPLALTALPPDAIGFTLQGPTPPPIPPGGSVTLNACFAPRRLRQHDTAFTFAYNSCRAPDTLRLHGVGYDSVVIRISDSVVARPGSPVEFTITIDSVVPAAYDVRGMTLTLRYNKTLLVPLDPPMRITAAAAAPWTTQATENAYVVGDTMATSKVTLSGTAIDNTTPNAVLARARMLALLGNALQTPVRITAATMADGNPKVGIVSTASFRIDSICYIQQQLVANHDDVFHLKLAVGADGPQALLWFTLPADALVQATLFDAFGHQVLPLTEEWRHVGSNMVTLDVGALPSGLYLARVVAGGNVAASIIIINH